MLLLVVQLCIVMPDGQTECEERSSYHATFPECAKMRRATKDWVETLAVDLGADATIVAKCLRGVDG